MHAEIAAQRLPGDLADLRQVDRLGVGHFVLTAPGDDAVPAIPEGREEREAGPGRTDGEDVRRFP